MPLFPFAQVVYFLFWSNFFNVLILEGWKCFQARMVFAEPFSARIVVLVLSGESWVRVSRWQWSVLFCDIITRSGSGSSVREDTHDGTVWVEMLNFECHILEAPSNHGSMRTVKVSLGLCDEVGESRPGSSRWGWELVSGENVRRKEASALRCLTVKDIFKIIDQ